MFGMHLRPELVLLQKTMVQVEGVARALDPRHDMWTASRPIVERWVKRELGPEARVNGVAPGTIVWPEGDEWGDELSRQRIVNQSALKRIGEPDDIAKAVDYLVSAAPYVTGQVIAVDGGRSIAL